MDCKDLHWNWDMTMEEYEISCIVVMLVINYLIE